ncbi:MAG: 3-isopropylmalate dehydratase [Candidatus Omnitrophica bacterium]|nr:3-isopropylmalate dehydratase [Candidatus Omnitrophota bacterium]MBU2474179.1 3-isopropylmalate dehydratase [Candidatus Omnitrophota bacterium]
MLVILNGKVFKFSDNINTDWIISGRYKFAITDMKKLAEYLFEDIRPGFFKELTPGESIIAAGANFGMGSSREQAPWVIKEAGIVCVVAKSFARIFYRNAFNIGLSLVEANTDNLQEADWITIDFDKGRITDTTNSTQVEFNPWDNFRKELVGCGGILNYLKKHKGFDEL